VRVKVRTDYKRCYQGSFCSEMGVFLVIYYIRLQTVKTGKNRKYGRRLKKGHQKFSTSIWKFFPKKGHSKILVRKFFSVPPNSAPKSPPMLEHIQKKCCGVLDFGASIDFGRTLRIFRLLQHEKIHFGG